MPATELPLALSQSYARRRFDRSMLRKEEEDSMEKACHERVRTSTWMLRAHGKLTVVAYFFNPSTRVWYNGN